MASEWPEAPLGDLVQNFDSRRIPLSSREREKRRGRFPYHGATGVMDHIDDFLFEGLHLLVAEDGSVETEAGKPFLQLVDGQFWVNNHAHVLRGATDDDTRFLYYALSTVAIRPYMSGSVQAKLSQGNLNRIPVPYPVASADRRTIAHILGTLDDKIELNRRMNETLGSMARAIFNSWFVDFDPVRAKAAGQGTGLPERLVDLFPDSFEESEWGEVPRGWEVGPLGRFLDAGLGGAWGESDASKRATVCIRCLRGIDCHDLAEGRIPDVPVRWVSPKQSADRHLSDGVILVEGSGSFCGRSVIWEGAYGELLGQPVGYSNFCKRLNPRCSVSQAIVCWMQMRQAYSNGSLQSFRTGTAFPNFDMNGALKRFLVVVPPIRLADEYARFFQFRQRLDLMAQSRTLAALRDALLPRLISGELRVPDAQSILKEAV